MTVKKMVFWSPADPVVKPYLENNPSLSAITKKFPYIFVCSNDINQKVYEIAGRDAIIVETENDMKLKGTAAFEKMREMDFDICIRLDVDSIVFDLNRLIKLASRTGPKQLLGWKRTKKRQTYIRGGCHAVGKYIIDNIAPIETTVGHEFGRGFDRSMNKNTIAIGGELIDLRLFEINENYTGKCPVWHPPKRSYRKELVIRHAKLWNSMHQGKSHV